MTKAWLLSIFTAVVASQSLLQSSSLLTKNLGKASLTAFNNLLGLDPTLNWKNATALTEAVGVQVYANVDSFVNVCKARQIYAQTLGYTYPACVNRFYLLNRDATPFDDAVTYVHTFKHLEFICSTGFDVFQFNLNCIDNAQQASGTVYQACFYKFQQTVQKNPLRFCEYVLLFESEGKRKNYTS
ncbi:unnamed protein product [Nippostrongylus brasiliensis]|uniref:Secreted protein n=1 Tax=Nippostrongylus brasiliensis TaxID=27835 RepID=A0A0N4YXP9_NIPBR|nr:unnamed protein product [Nippostrongylus brasiliensis]